MAGALKDVRLRQIMKPYLSVVIPAYNEEKRLPPTLDDVVKYLRQQKFEWEVLVVNDGSQDKTAEVVKKFSKKEARVKLIDNRVNQGKGAVVKQGMLLAQGEWRLFMDADNSTPISEVEEFWPHTKDYEVIIGSRYVKGSKITERQPFIRRFISRAGNILIQLLILPGIRDTQCGFKMFSARAAEAIFPRQRFMRWSFDMEILAIAKRLGFKIKEVPVVWRNAPQSKLKAAKAALRTLKDLLLIRWNLTIGRYR